MTMPLLTAIPASMMTPMSAAMLSVRPVTSRPKMTPTMPSGTVNMMMKGWTKCSNWEAMIM